MRQPSEWGIGRVKCLFSYLEYKVCINNRKTEYKILLQRNLRVLQMPLAAMFLICVHLKNIHGCLYGSQVFNSELIVCCLKLSLDCPVLRYPHTQST